MTETCDRVTLCRLWLTGGSYCGGQGGGDFGLGGCYLDGSCKYKLTGYGGLEVGYSMLCSVFGSLLGGLLTLHPTGIVG